MVIFLVGRVRDQTLSFDRRCGLLQFRCIFLDETLANRRSISIISVSASIQFAYRAIASEVESVANELFVQTFRFSVSYIIQLPGRAVFALQRQRKGKNDGMVRLLHC
jgi:hypothetical protein